MEKRFILPSNLICGYFDCSVFGDLKVSPVRTRTLYEIEYYIEDGKTTFSCGIAYPIKKDHVRISSPGEEGNSLLPFKTKFVKFHAEGALAELLDSMPRYISLKRAFEAESMLDEILCASSAKNRDELFLYGKLLTFISFLCEEGKSSANTDSFKHTVIARAKSFIKANYSQRIRLSDIAKEVNLSPNYFHTLFSEICGVTPHDYLLEYRIGAAKELLCTTPLSIAEIAEKCGFGNQQYMSMVFKSKTGKTPAQCKKEYQREYLI